jgi:hypothetical protein
MNFQRLVKSVQKISVELYWIPIPCLQFTIHEDSTFCTDEAASLFVGSFKDLLRSERNGKNTLNTLPPHPKKRKTKVSEVAFSFHCWNKRVL